MNEYPVGIIRFAELIRVKKIDPYDIPVSEREQVQDYLLDRWLEKLQFIKYGRTSN